MDLRLTVDLPRDLDRMNTLRHVLDGALDGLGVAAQAREDIGLIVSETWANVIAHVTVGVAFQVRATVDEEQCVIEVTNPGDQASDVLNALTASGHSLRIVSTLADAVDVDRDGLLVKVTKKL
ncbi:ATP-binding protein [Dactylosporangium sp. AC04546]|uniref:ATP-binding protein n=1 Tax=Dactylosporangium sp. AC04546 TaxID=2862460 RepID=UPI001EE07886|nr:ATP-binding protein [Dactylosporangium sp. AC04546]WVK84362.1 ATP-binding protein [Dactylosporangium sp. AC04546]